METPPYPGQQGGTELSYTLAPAWPAAGVDNTEQSGGEATGLLDRQRRQVRPPYTTLMHYSTVEW